MCRGWLFINTQLREAAQSSDCVPPAIICIINFHFNTANMTSFFYPDKFLFLLLKLLLNINLYNPLAYN